MLDCSKLLEEIQNRYTVGPKYAQAYLEYWFGSRGKTSDSLQEILDSPLPEPMWFDYAMSTNWRGQIIRQVLDDYIPQGARRYLDVGSGFGGFLVAFAEIGLEVYGIEIDPQRIQFSKANCLDHNIHDCVFYASILEDDLASRLGTFDVITCIDVIEHVLDTKKAIQNMVNLLNPRGILMLEIPNKYSFNYVSHDGHFGLFGITLLDRPDAIEYHKAFFEFEYDVGEYYLLKFYRHEFERLGCQVTLLSLSDTSVTYPQKKDVFTKVWAGYSNYRANYRHKLPRGLDIKIQWRFARYMLKLHRDINFRSQKDSGRVYLQNTYLKDFWKLLVTKP